MSGANSASACRQAPHGGHEVAFACTATVANRRWPIATAAKRALRSAHIVTPKEAFSTFTPTIGSPPPAGRPAALAGGRREGAGRAWGHRRRQSYGAGSVVPPGAGSWTAPVDGGWGVVVVVVVVVAGGGV